MSIDVLKLLTENRKIVGENSITTLSRENDINKEKLQKRDCFNKILNQVREDNIRSTYITDDNIEIREKNKIIKRKESEISEEYYYSSEVNQEYIAAASSERKNIIEIDPADSEKAGKMIEESLREICDVLGLKTLPISEINFVKITDTVEEQFSEILFLVGKIIEDIENGELLQENNKDIDNLLNILVTNKFKMELAFNTLGVSEDIQRKVDNRDEGGGFNGIIKALEPLQLKMLSLHSEKIFKSFLGMENEEVIKTIVEKIKKLISENNGEIIVTTSEKEQKIEELSAFDSKTYRCILKIDKPLGASTKSEESIEKGIAISIDNKSQNDLDGSKSKFEEAFLNRNGFIFTNSKDSFGVGHILNSGYSSLSSNILKEEEIAEQITARFRSMIKDGLSEVKILLKPESLGEVKIRIRMEGDMVMARIEVENKEVKEIMEKNLPLLREALSQHNLTAGTFQIDTNNDGESDKDNSKYYDKFDKERDNKQKGEEEENKDKGSERKNNSKNSNIEFLV